MAQSLEYNREVLAVTPVTVPAFDGDIDVIQQLDDEPNDVGGLSAQELKAKFDETGAALAGFINNQLIPAVVADGLTESARQAAETERVANERERVENENIRVPNEHTRVQNEQARAVNEARRVQNEQARTANEARRVENEAERVRAEAARENAETGYVARAAESAALSRSWAEGGTGTREGEEKDNAHYWATVAMAQADRAAAGPVEGVYSTIVSDRITGEKFSLVVINGRLSLLGVSAGADTAKLQLADIVTGAVYALAAEDGRIILEEV